VEDGPLLFSWEGVDIDPLDPVTTCDFHQGVYPVKVEAGAMEAVADAAEVVGDF